MKNNNLIRTVICFTLCLSIAMPLFTQAVKAGESFEIVTGNGVIIGWEHSTWSDGPGGSGGKKKYEYKYDMASTIEKMIEICKKYSDKTVTTGVRSQINWMNQLYITAVNDFVSSLDLGDTLLLALLNHEDINKTLLKSSYSMGDINREVADQILSGAKGYVSVDDIAKAVGLSAQDVRDILTKIAAGSVTEKTIAIGKKTSKNTNRGTYLYNQAERQEKVFNCLTDEVNRMMSEPESLAILRDDIGSGYVDSLLSGQPLNQYQVELYKKYLASTLDSVADSNTPCALTEYDLTKKESYTVAKKTRSALSKLYKYEIGGAQDDLSEEMRDFLDKHLDKNGLSEKEAKEFLILCGEYDEGDRDVTEAAKQLLAGHKHLRKFEKTLETSGKVFDAADKVKKAAEFIDYWADDYAEQEMMLDHLVENLKDSDADKELMVAAEDLQKEYTNKMEGTFDLVYNTLLDKGISAVKSTFPPLGIAEATISLTGTLTGADDHVSALETGFAMQGICEQALDNYEKAVVAVNKGDTSDEALSDVLTTFAVAKHSLISYYEAMVDLAEDKEQKETYSKELNRLKGINFGYVTVPGSIGGR